MNNKIRILYYGDAPTVATGFGTVTRGILTNLHKTGKYDIKVMGVNYWGDPHEFPFPIWPIGIGSTTSAGQPDPFGRRRSFDMMMSPDIEFDVLFMIQDSFIMEFMTAPTSEGHRPLDILRSRKDIISAVYFPVDGVPKKSWVDSMNSHDVVVAYTEYGKNQCIKKVPGIEGKIKNIPHGVNASDFRPVPKSDVDKFKKEYFGPLADRFIITNVNRNQQRKDIPRTLMAFKEFKKLRPNALLYLHMAARDQGWNITELIDSMGLKFNEDVVLPANFGPNQGFPREVVNLIYNASDVVISTTLGEGWGLSITEAMACKVPIIFPNNTSLTEIVGENEERGYLTKSGASANDWAVLPNDNEVMRPLTSVEDLAEKLIHVYDNREEAEKKADAAFKWVHSNLLWDKHIAPKWDRLLTSAVLEKAKKQASKSGFVSAEEL